MPASLVFNSNHTLNISTSCNACHTNCTNETHTDTWPMPAVFNLVLACDTFSKRNICATESTALIQVHFYSLLWKLTGSLLKKSILFFNGTRRFIKVFTKTHHCTLSWASRIQITPSIPTSIRSILMLSSHLRLGLQVVSFFRASQPITYKHLLLYHACVPHVPPTSSTASHEEISTFT
jgi:hypothetical protein